MQSAQRPGVTRPDALAGCEGNDHVPPVIAALDAGVVVVDGAANDLRQRRKELCATGIPDRANKSSDT